MARVYAAAEFLHTDPMSRLSYLLTIFRRYYRNLGVRVALYAATSILVVVLGPSLAQFLPDSAIEMTDFDSVLPVLTILASSMLAVSTFSLNIMVSSYRGAAQATTPRVHRLLLENTRTQKTLATFIGAFVYSLSAIILYRLNFYDPDAAIVVMGLTVLVAILVVLSLLRWVELLKTLGTVDDSLETVTKRTRTVLTDLAQHRALGGVEMTDETVMPDVVTPIEAPKTGYLRLIDIEGLDEDLPSGVSLYVLIRPGTHVLKGQVIAQAGGAIDRATHDKICTSFEFGFQRSYEQDASFGLSVLSEIASRALSPGINDPGTAIEALQRITGLLWEFAGEAARSDTEALTSRVFLRPGPRADLVRAAFAQSARDGAQMIEVAIELRRALAALASVSDTELAQAAQEMALLAEKHAEEAGLLDVELARLKEINVPGPDGGPAMAS